MGFSRERLELLAAPLNKERIARRTQAGKQLSYIETWDAIETANAIFGYDGWSYSVKRLELAGEVWLAVVEVVVPHAAEGDTYRYLGREDVGVGIPAGTSSMATETAIKGAVSDALKRALRTFGDQFGNGLYDKSPDHDAPQAVRSPAGREAAQHAQPPGIGPERAQKLAALARKAGRDQGYTDQQVDQWIVAALRRLGQTDLTRLTEAQGQQLLTEAARADMAPPEAP